MGNLLQELRRRKVFRVAAVYAVVAWLLIQVADTVLPALQMPQWTVSFVTVLFILGFIPTLIAAWAFEITPEGVTPDSGSQIQTQIPAPQNQGLIYATFLLVLLVAGFQIADRFIFVDQQQNEASGQVSNLNSNFTSVLRSTILLDQPLLQQTTPIRSRLDITPDGSVLFYTNFIETIGQLFVRNLASGNTRLLGEGINSGNPRSSPDGRRLAIGNGSTNLRIVDVQTGLWESTPLTKRSGPPIEWLSNDEVLYSSFDRSLHKFTLSTGEDVRVTQAPAGTQAHQNPHMLPGGRAFLYEISLPGFGMSSSKVDVYDLDTNTSKSLISSGYSAKYAPSGHVVFIRSGDLLAVPFDLENLQIIGPEAKIIDGVSSQPVLGNSAYTLSDGGRLVYLPGKELEYIRSEFVWQDRSGNIEDIGLPNGNYADPQLSPDGQSLALTNYLDGSSSDIWVFDLTRQTFGRRTFNELARNPKWSPDGTRLVYTVVDQGIWSTNADGTGLTEQLTDEPTARPDSFIGNGNNLLYLTGLVGNAKVHNLSYRDNSWQSTPLMQAQINSWGAVVSPDGRWISYVSDETGQQEIFVRPYPATDDGKWQISTQGGREPIWGANGDELYYLQFDGTLLSVTINTDNGFEPGNPQVLLTGIPVNSNDPPSYDVSNDGQRFIRYPPLMAPAEAPELVTAEGNAILIVVENWFEELKRLAPPDPR